MDIFHFIPGDTPLLLSVPHAGIYLPEEIAPRLTPEAHALPDTDWHVDRLYEFVREMGAAILVATHSRYVVDLNRDPDGASLYPGADVTELCPSTTFDEHPIYLSGEEPAPIEVGDRIARYWRPYHARLAETLAALKARFGHAVLFDAHSIRSRVPRFFEGRLPDLNLGTAGGASADPDLADRLHAVLQEAEGYSVVRDGRFRGGYITRHYGAPAEGVHAVQLELVQQNYMDETPPYGFRTDRADRLRAVLRDVIAEVIAWSAAR